MPYCHCSIMASKTFSGQVYVYIPFPFFWQTALSYHMCLELYRVFFNNFRLYLQIIPLMFCTAGFHWGTFCAIASMACPAAIRVSQLLLFRKTWTCHTTLNMVKEQCCTCNVLNKLSLVFLPFFVLLSKLFHIDLQAIFIYIKITA